LTVAGVARRIGHAVAFGTAQVLGHLGLQGTLHQSPGELLEQAVFTNEVFLRFVISQQAVYEFVAYGRYSSFSKYGSFLPNNRLHKNPYTLASCCAGRLSAFARQSGTHFSSFMRPMRSVNQCCFFPLITVLLVPNGITAKWGE
jgi:hypothetical protein